MEGLKRDWGLELVHDQSVTGSIPATSATFSREPGMLKFVWCWHTHNRMGNKNNLISAALTGLNKARASSYKNMDGQLNPVIGYLVLKGLHKHKLIR